MARLGLETNIVDQGTYSESVKHFKEHGVLLPTLSQLANPATLPAACTSRLAGVDPDAVDPLNLFRVHWYNSADRRSRIDVPGYRVLPSSLTGVAAPIVVLLGERFPLITAHKVLAAYGCLVPRVVTGQFDPIRHKAVWPSTGNYCRGGVAISRMLNCHGVAVLPEGMSRERFDWLERWVLEPQDIVRTVGTESNVKEIYDKCAELDATAENIIFNQFCEFGNYLVHYTCTGRALEHAFEDLSGAVGKLNPAAFVSATGSAGTIGAGDYLKEHHGTRIVAVEALECPTMLSNGFGEHNIQGIGDKHIPYIHNVMNTDLVAGVSDRATDQLFMLFNTDAGRRYLAERKGVDAATIQGLSSLGFSGICNVLGAIKTARALDLGPNDAVLTIATDNAGMYQTERQKFKADYPEGFDTIHGAEVYGQHLAGQGTDHIMELTHADKKRIFNLGYFTWVEQQGVELADFEARRDQSFWRGLHGNVAIWDEMIRAFNAETGVEAGL
jgi:cysteine synthase A